jgi:hypothetical protein
MGFKHVRLTDARPAVRDAELSDQKMKDVTDFLKTELTLACSVLSLTIPYLASVIALLPLWKLKVLRNGR